MSTHLLCFSFVIKQSNCCVYLDCAGSRPDDGWPSEASGCERGKHTQRADLTHSTIYNEHNIGYACVLFCLFACLFSDFNFRIHIIHFVIAELCSVSLPPTLRVPATQFSLHSVPNNRSSHPLHGSDKLNVGLTFFSSLTNRPHNFRPSWYRLPNLWGQNKQHRWSARASALFTRTWL